MRSFGRSASGAGKSNALTVFDFSRLRRKSGPDLAAAVKALAGKARAQARRQRAEPLGFVVHENLDGYTDGQCDRVRKTLRVEFVRNARSSGRLSRSPRGRTQAGCSYGRARTPLSPARR
ncbi:hypothetical protein [Streptomyces sp. NPDC059597]|uniref:hypothetical protein n=1 Tax=Streptomyces sp. NPDC059597 TaxID=3346879 RepID=UPI0036B30ADA